MKLSKQSKKEIQFGIMVVKIIIGWTLIIGSLVLGFCLDKNYCLNYEYFVAGLFGTFLLGIFILIMNNEKIVQKERIREFYDDTPANKIFPKKYIVTTFSEKVYFAEMNQELKVNWICEGVPEEIKEEFELLINNYRYKL